MRLVGWGCGQHFRQTVLLTMPADLDSRRGGTLSLPICTALSLSCWASQMGRVDGCLASLQPMAPTSSGAYVGSAGPLLLTRRHTALAALGSNEFDPKRCSLQLTFASAPAGPRPHVGARRSRRRRRKGRLASRQRPRAPDSSAAAFSWPSRQRPRVPPRLPRDATSLGSARRSRRRRALRPCRRARSRAARRTSTHLPGASPRPFGRSRRGFPHLPTRSLR